MTQNAVFFHFWFVHRWGGHCCLQPGPFVEIVSVIFSQKRSRRYPLLPPAWPSCLHTSARAHGKKLKNQETIQKQKINSQQAQTGYRVKRPACGSKGRAKSISSRNFSFFETFLFLRNIVFLGASVEKKLRKGQPHWPLWGKSMLAYFLATLDVCVRNSMV